MIKPKKYALLAEYMSTSTNFNIVRSFFDFDTIDEAFEMQSEMMKGRGGVFIVLKKNELINDEYDDVIEYLYDAMAVYYSSWQGKDSHLVDIEDVQVIQTFRLLPNGVEIAEGEPIVTIEDEEQKDLWYLFVAAKL